MKKIWEYINGNKTLICAALLYALTLSIVRENLHPDIVKMAEYILLACGGASLTHKVVKATKKEQPSKYVK